MAVSWKTGAIEGGNQVSLGELASNARNFYSNRLDILDEQINNLNMQKRTGAVTDMGYLNALQAMQNRYKQSFIGGTDAVAPIQDLQQQGSEAVAKQGFQDFIKNQEMNLQKTYNNADIQWQSVQKDYAANKISTPAYEAQRDAYYALQRERGTYQPPQYSFEQFKPGATLNVYQSGRIRDIAREEQIRNAFAQAYGVGKNVLNQENVYAAAGSYLPIEAIAQIFKQQKLAGVPLANKAGQIGSTYNYASPSGAASPNYKFPGTGGAPASPSEKIYDIKMYR